MSNKRSRGKHIYSEFKKSECVYLKRVDCGVCILIIWVIFSNLNIVYF